MGQSTILAAGTTAATSSDVTVASGATVSIGLFASAGPILISGPIAVVVMDTPGGDIGVAQLSDSTPAVSITTPGTYRVVRAPLTVAVGVFSET